MSAALVRKGLSIVDSQCSANTKKRKKSKNGKEVFSLAPENHKLLAKTYKKGSKGVKVNLLSTQRKLTVEEARKTHKSKEQILKENLRKLELIKSASQISLDKDTVNQIIERAVTRRPIKKAKKVKKEKKTAFTEEDFKKFEEEYFDE